MKLLLITNSYPYGGMTEEAFVAPELEALRARFDRVTVMPQIRSGVPVYVPEDIEVSDSLCAARPSWRHKLRALVTPGVWRDAWRDRRQIRSVASLRAALAYYTYARYYAARLKEIGVDAADTLIYTFWFDYVTYGAAMLEGARVISRAHGYDIYEEEGFISRTLRQRTLAAVERVYVASKAGADYLRRLFPDFADKFGVSYLGSRQPVEMSPCGGAMPDGALRLLTVARLSPVKRVPMLLEALKCLAQTMPGRGIEWTVVGCGGDEKRLKRIIDAGLPDNLNVRLLGGMDNEHLHRLMASGNFDAMVLTSRSEGGLPVCMCEALSYGIPLIATAVGGVPEIVNEETGLLLPKDFTAEEFAEQVSRFLTATRLDREELKRIWRQKHSASELRKRFADEIAGLGGV